MGSDDWGQNMLRKLEGYEAFWLLTDTRGADITLTCSVCGYHATEPKQENFDQTLRIKPLIKEFLKYNACCCNCNRKMYKDPYIRAKISQMKYYHKLVQEHPNAKFPVHEKDNWGIQETKFLKLSFENYEEVVKVRYMRTKGDN